MLRDHINHAVRASAALALRHTPALRGRWHVARAVNKGFAPLSKPFCTEWVRMRLGHEMLVDLRSNTEFPPYYLADFDTEDIRSALRLIKPDSVVLDVGANVGFWSIPMARHLKGKGCLHAFEPVPGNVRRLRENVRRNSLENTVHLHEVGLSDQNRALQISLRGDFGSGSETGNAAIVIDSDDLQFRCADIHVRRLDDVVNSIGVDRIDFIKADIEGHEDKFLAGAANVICRFRPILYVEINEAYYQRQGRVAATVFGDWLKANSYQSALCKKGKWHFDSVRNCRPLDNAFFVPSEASHHFIETVNR